MFACCPFRLALRIALVASAACGGMVESAPGGDAGPSAPGQPPAQPPAQATAPNQPAIDPSDGTGATHHYIDEAVACEKYAQARLDAIARLGCTFEEPRLECPGVLNRTGFCALGYDEGTIDRCVELLRSHESCEDFRTKPCAIQYKKCQ